MKVRAAREIWEAALGELQVQVSRANYDTWLKDTEGLSYQGNQFMVGAPTTFATEWLESRLRSLIRKTLMGITGEALEVQFQVYQKQRNGAGVPTSSSIDTSGVYQPSSNNSTGSPYRFNPKYTFASFIVGSCNRLAHAAALGVAEHPGRDYNPLFIYGGAGLGKTHLLHAIGHRALEASLDILYVTSERFTNEFINAIRERKTEEFRSKYRGPHLLLMDDIQFIEGKEQTQEAVFHMFNDLHNAGRHIVLSSDRSPKSLSLLEDRLRSRFEWGLIVDLEPPDLETRLAILRAKAEELKSEVPLEVLDIIARRIQKNIRELEGALNRVVALARLTRAPLDQELAAQALANITTPPSRRSLTPEVLINAVANYFHLTPEALQGKRRDKPIALARQIAMYLMREETQLPWTEIGRALGGKNHATIMHGYAKVVKEIDDNSVLRRDVLEIREQLYNKVAQG